MKRNLPKSLDRIASWFRKDEKPRPAQRTPRPAANGKPKQKSVEDLSNVITDMEAALTRLHQSGDAVTAGKVQVLRFDKLKAELGGKWARYSERIERVIDGAISQQVSDKDMSWKLGEHAHVLVFSSVTPAEAEVKCALIREQVEEFFRSTPRLAGKIVVETAVAAMDGSIHLEAIDDLETLYGRMNLARKADKSAEKTTATPKPIEPPEKEKKTAPKEEQVNWREVTDNVDTAREKIQTNTFLYQSAWDTTTKEVVATAITPQDPTPDSIGRGGSILKEWTGGAMTFALDEASIGSLRAKEAKRSKSQTMPLWMQTHYGSYENQKFRAMLIKNWDNLDMTGPSKRIIELVGVPKSQKHNPGSELFNTLSKYTGEMAVCLDLAAPQLGFLQHGNIRWAGFTMRDTNLDEEAGMDAIANFVSKVSTQNVRLYAREIPSKNLVAAAIGFGIRYVFSKPEENNADVESTDFNINDLCSRP